MINSSKVWVVTDIDGTLMDHSYNYSPAKERIRWLQGLNIPIIPCTSKTAAEVKVIRRELNLRDPYIVENGGAIYGEKADGTSWDLILGETYNKLEKILHSLSTDVGYSLKPLNKLSDKEAIKLTGLEGNALTLMRDRHWSMPFLNPPIDIEIKLGLFISNYNVDIFRGNRMSHLLSRNSNKGKAIDKLIDFSNNPNVKVIGLGDSPNDFPLLKRSDYKVVIPSYEGPNQQLIKELGDIDYIISDQPHGYGWNKEVKCLVEKLI